MSYHLLFLNKYTEVTVHTVKVFPVSQLLTVLDFTFLAITKSVKTKLWKIYRCSLLKFNHFGQILELLWFYSFLCINIFCPLTSTFLFTISLKFLRKFLLFLLGLQLTEPTITIPMKNQDKPHFPSNFQMLIFQKQEHWLTIFSAYFVATLIFFKAIRVIWKPCYFQTE